MAEIILNGNEMLVKLAHPRAGEGIVTVKLEDPTAYPLGHTLRIPLADPVFDGEYIKLMVTEGGWQLLGIERV
ncbi:MAG TPA: hypothetical protein VGB98_09035 [Pyrinomonadaceae bacterium]|jgi:hypothetical protein